MESCDLAINLPFISWRGLSTITCFGLVYCDVSLVAACEMCNLLVRAQASTLIPFLCKVTYVLSCF
jgi:hypothetical protein